MNSDYICMCMFDRGEPIREPSYLDPGGAQFKESPDLLREAKGCTSMSEKPALESRACSGGDSVGLADPATISSS